MRTMILAAAMAAYVPAAVYADTDKAVRTSTIAWSAVGIKRVEVQVPPAEIFVRSAPIDQVQVQVEYKIETHGEEQAWIDSVLDGLSIEAVRKDTRLILRDKREGEARSARAKRRDTEATITVTVPDWTSVEVRQTAGEVTLRGKLENVMVSMKAGEIHMEGDSAHIRKVEARTRVGEVYTEIGNRKEHREGLFAGSSVWENPSPEARATVELFLTAGEISLVLQ